MKPNRYAKKTLKFLGLGTTLAAAIGLGAFGGRELDKYWGLEKPLCTAFGSMLGLAVGMWSVVKNLKTK